MKIKTKLWLNVFLKLSSTVIICLIIFFPIKNRFKSGEQVFNLAEQIANESVYLHILTHEYIQYNKAHILSQWKIKSDAIHDSLEKISKLIAHQNQSTIINQMMMNYKHINEFFKKTAAEIKNPSDTALLKRLESFLLLNSQYLITNALSLKGEIHANQKKIIYQGLLIILLTFIVISVFNATLLIIINRTIVKSLKILNKGVENVSKGNFQQVLRSPYNDELDILAGAFNQMIQKLETNYNELKNEIQMRKLSENTSKKNEERYRLLFNSGIDAIFVISINQKDFSSRFIECNDIALQRYGYSKSEILNMAPTDLSTIEVVQDVAEKIKKVLIMGDALIETVHKTKSNKKVPVEISARKFTLQNETAILAIVRDISERKKMQERLLEVLELNQTVISESLLGITAYKANGQCIIANEVAAKNIGGTKDKVLAQNYHQLENWKETGLYDAAQTAMQKGEAQNKTIHVVTSFGKDVWLKCYFKKFQLKDEPHLLLIFDNITEQKLIERELRQKNEELERSNKELDDFAYIASHDLKEPLRGISSYSAFLLEDYQKHLDEKGRDKLNTLVKLCQREVNMVESLLWYSRVGRSELSFEIIDLNDLITSILESIQVMIDRFNVHIKIPQVLPKISADRVRIHEIYLNLITNGIKFNDKDEKWVELGFEVKQTDANDNVEKNNRSPDDLSNIIFYVRDNGIGIREKHQNKVFTIFKRLHAKEKYGGGTGVGLSIVKKNIEKFGGAIWLESTIEKGTTFYFTLPVNEKRKVIG